MASRAALGVARGGGVAGPTGIMPQEQDGRCLDPALLLVEGGPATFLLLKLETTVVLSKGVEARITGGLGWRRCADAGPPPMALSLSLQSCTP